MKRVTLDRRFRRGELRPSRTLKKVIMSLDLQYNTLKITTQYCLALREQQTTLWTEPRESVVHSYSSYGTLKVRDFLGLGTFFRSISDCNLNRVRTEVM